jgi:hypothetical protein
VAGEWERLSVDPRSPEAATLRARDADREVLLEALRDAYADGRLDRDEYERRVEDALAVRVVADALPVLADLVAPPRPPSRRESVRAEALRKVRREERDARNGWLGVTLLTTGIWGATSLGAGDVLFFWPVFPSVAIGVGALLQRLNREQRLEELEEKVARTRRGRRD